MEKNNNMKIKNLILEQLSTRDKSKLENLKTNGYEVITTRKYNSDKTKFDYETVGSGSSIVYLPIPTLIPTPTQHL
jgi:hypothetical protein